MLAIFVFVTLAMLAMSIFSLESLQFLDECRALQVQQTCGLALVALGAFERPPDERQLDALDIALEVDPVLGQPRLGPSTVPEWFWISGARSWTSITERPCVNASARSTVFSS